MRAARYVATGSQDAASKAKARESVSPMRLRKGARAMTSFHSPKPGLDASSGNRAIEKLIDSQDPFERLHREVEEELAGWSLWYKDRYGEESDAEPLPTEATS